VSNGNIFICYRHEDSSAYAGWLADALGRHFGRERVFRDVDSQRGVDFRYQVGEAIGSCDVLLAVIGPKWLMIQDESGRRRIDHPRDLVALEIAAALKRGIRVIPVLVAEARMPREADLPELLAGLAYRTAVELSHAGWDHQISGLIDDLRAGTALRAAPPSLRSVATTARQNQLDERNRRVARAIPVVIGDTSGPGKARLRKALLPELQHTLASMHRDAKLAYRLGLAMLHWFGPALDADLGTQRARTEAPCDNAAKAADT
jgi:hypothetical protein